MTFFFQLTMGIPSQYSSAPSHKDQPTAMLGGLSIHALVGVTPLTVKRSLNKGMPSPQPTHSREIWKRGGRKRGCT